MGGRANKGNPNLIIASKLRELKKKGLKDEDAQTLCDLMESGTIARFKVLEWLTKLKSQAQTDVQELRIIQNITEVIKQQHGTNEVKTQVNIQNNISVNTDDIKEILDKL